MWESRPLVLIAVLLLFISGCYSAQRDIKKQDVLGKNSYSLSDLKSVGVMMSADGSYGGHVYSGSAKIVTSRIRQSLFNTVGEIKVFDTTSREEALKSCLEKSTKYLIIPEILHWEDRATNWSGLPDRIRIQLDLQDAVSKKTVNSIVFDARSTWFTFVNDPPEDMLDESFESCVRQLLHAE